MYRKYQFIFIITGKILEDCDGAIYMVDFTQPVGMEIVDLAMELEEILGHRVDIVTYNAVKNRLFHYIKDELIYA